ncbi:MAG TPA: helix-turn-helix domain-containing protein [Chloroflexota bacterium]
MSDYVSAIEAAGILGVKPATLYAYVSRGLVRSYRRGLKRARLYRRSELEELVRVRPSARPATSAIPLAAEWMPYV